jgi:transcriptional regulator with XRE-family HTH domain
MMKSSSHATKQHILRRAKDLMGRDKLAKRLGIPESMLDAWIRGDTTMPDGKLLDLAAALVEFAQPKS